MKAPYFAFSKHSCYLGNMITRTKQIKIERVQTGIRIEKKLLKVLKGIAEHRDVSVGQMLELILLHSFENRSCFSKQGIETVNGLKKIYGLDYDVHDYEKFLEEA
jgi:hypothetical protein